MTELDDTEEAVHPTELTATERQAFISALQMADTLRDRISRDVHPATGLSIPDFVVLARLREHPGHTWSGMKALAANLGWSPSRLSHQLQRMERRGLIDRVPDEASRLITISITPDTVQLFERAVVLHAASVRAHLFAHITQDQSAALVTIASNIVQALGPAPPDDRGVDQ